MHEIPFFFNSGPNQLFGMLHNPTTQRNNFGFVFCSPLAEEALWSQRVYVNFARILASMGYTVLRFDYGGHGDSDGEFVDSTVETRINDITAAITTLKEKGKDIQKIGLLGLRFGATLAALVAEQYDHLTKLILWEPVIHGQKYMKSLFRINITTQTAVYREVKYNTEALIEQLRQGKSISIDGYSMLFPFYQQIINIDLASGQKKFQGHTLHIEIKKRLQSANASAGKPKLGYLQETNLPVAEKTFWKEIKEYYYKAENLSNTTLQWLEDNK